MAKYLTKQRGRLIEYLSSHTDEQITARQIADALTADEISVSAVYRNLSAMEKEGLLTRSAAENTKEAFFRSMGSDKCKNSLHLLCRVCGKSIHLDEASAERLFQSTLESTGFEISKAETVLYGTCAECRK